MIGCSLVDCFRTGSFPLSHATPEDSGVFEGATNIRPPAIHRYPTWDLSLVLQALSTSPFEPLASVSLRHLSLKVAFLLAVTSARRVSELAALSIRKDLCIFRPNMVVFRLDPSFMPKVNSSFHRAQEIVFPDFCPSPRHRLEEQWHTFDVRRALWRYTSRTASFRKTEAPLVSFHASSLEKKVSSRTAACWIKACISLAYSSKAGQFQVGCGSLYKMCGYIGSLVHPGISDIFRAAIWTLLTPFVRHYKLDSYASAEASFEHRVLQRVHSNSGDGPSQPPPHEFCCFSISHT